MKKLVAIFVLLFFATASSAQLPLTGAGKAVGASYVGPVDTVAGATYCYSLRACNAAYATGSNPGAIVCNAATFTTCVTVNILSNGKLDVATASGSSACATTCVVKQLYDQIGGKHVTCASGTACPTLTFNCLGALPCLTFAGASSQTLTNVAITTSAAPNTLSYVAERTANFTTLQAVVAGNNLVQSGFSSVASSVFGFGGSGVQTVTSVTDSILHALQYVQAAANGGLNVDGVSNAFNASANSLTQPYAIGSSGNGTNFFTGIFTESIVYEGAALSTSNQNLLCHNQRVYWESTGSC